MFTEEYPVSDECIECAKDRRPGSEPIDIPTTTLAVEQVADALGTSITAGGGELVTFITTEGGVRLRLVAPLAGGGR